MAKTQCTHSRYFNEFMRLKCAPDLLQWKLYPNVKEITEAFGLFNAVRTHVLNNDYSEFSNKQNVVCVIGDGNTPRLAALFAMRTNWWVASIDPRLKDPWREKFGKIDRLACFPDRFEDATVTRLGNWSRANLITILPHAHVDPDKVLEKFPETQWLITNPCCYPLRPTGMIPDISYNDYGIWSEKRAIEIYRIRKN